MGKLENEEFIDDSKLALEKYLSEIRSDYLPWYTSRVGTNRTWWAWLNYLIITTGVLTTVIGSLVTAELSWAKNNIEIIKTLVIVVPLIGTFASSLMLQTKAAELYTLREKGREAVQFLVSIAEQRYASCKVEKDFSDLHEFLIEEIRKVEQGQSNDFFGLSST